MLQLPLRLLLLPLLCALALPAVAATWHVAPGGNDANAGTLSKPWRSLQHAADSVQAGDTIVVAGGDYAGATFGASASGSPGHPTVLKAGPGATPNIISDGGKDAGINLEGVSWMVVDGFTINNRSSAGIRAVGGKQWGLTCAHVTLRNNRLDRNGKWGIFTAFCDDLVIEHNEASRSIAQHGIYTSNSGDRPIIRGNRIWGNRQCGIHMNGDASEGGDGIISGALIEANIIHDNGRGGGSAINMDGVQNSIVRNNLLYDNHASGISLFRIDGGGPSTGNRVVNNTVVVAADGRWALNIQNGAANNTVRNNILWNLGSRNGSLKVSADSLPGLDSDYNVVSARTALAGGSAALDLAAWQTLGHGAHSLTTVRPLFVDAAAGDYRLAAGSPAVDAGQALPDVATDLAGTPRPQGTGFDIGAFERATRQPAPNGTRREDDA